jgi:hypothetical protein
MFTKVARLLRRRDARPPDGAEMDRLERERLTAEYTGSFVKNRGPEYGISTKSQTKAQ